MMWPTAAHFRSGQMGRDHPPLICCTADLTSSRRECAPAVARAMGLQGTGSLEGLVKGIPRYSWPSGFGRQALLYCLCSQKVQLNSNPQIAITTPATLANFCKLWQGSSSPRSCFDSWEGERCFEKESALASGPGYHVASEFLLWSLR